MLSVLLTQCRKEPVPSVPDSNFLDALIKLGIDTNGDHMICTCEVKTVTYLNVSQRDIADLTGIEMFVHLDTLYCFDNRLSLLYVSGNVGLVTLGCSNNQLTKLDISSCAELSWLDVSRKSLTAPDLSRNDSIGEGNRVYSSGDPILSQMPTLGEVCVWEMPFPPEGLIVDTTGSPASFSQQNAAVNKFRA